MTGTLMEDSWGAMAELVDEGKVALDRCVQLRRGA